MTYALAPLHETVCDGGTQQRTGMPSPADTAGYIAAMAEGLAMMADRQGLTVLSLMLAMARDQACSDAESAPYRSGAQANRSPG